MAQLQSTNIYGNLTVTGEVDFSQSLTVGDSLVLKEVSPTIIFDNTSLVDTTPGNMWAITAQNYNLGIIRSDGAGSWITSLNLMTDGKVMISYSGVVLHDIEIGLETGIRSSLYITNDILPETDSSSDLGSSTGPKYFANAYIDTVTVNNTLTSNDGDLILQRAGVPKLTVGAASVTFTDGIIGSSSGDLIIERGGTTKLTLTTSYTQVDGTSDILHLVDSSAAGNPYISFYQTTTRGAYIQFVDVGNELRLNSDIGLLTLRSAGEEALRVQTSRQIYIPVGLQVGASGSVITQMRVV